MDAADVLSLPPHSVTSVAMKPGKNAGTIDIKFDVLNALTKPKKHPVIQLTIKPTPVAN